LSELNQNLSELNKTLSELNKNWSELNKKWSELNKKWSELNKKWSELKLHWFRIEDKFGQRGSKLVGMEQKTYICIHCGENRSHSYINKRLLACYFA
jgi:predicted nuclease with TOPRIM domain